MRPSRSYTIGVLGGGQLGRMLGLAGIPLGLNFRFFDPNQNSPAKSVGHLTVARFDDEKALKIFASDVDLITYEFENVPTSAIAVLIGAGKAVQPSILSLETAQDRLHEKSLFQKLLIPTPAFHVVDTEEDLKKAHEKIGLPMVLKTRRQGYDGKGQAVIRTEHDLSGAWHKLSGAPLIAEAFIPFDRELSLLCVGSTKQENVFYPLTENTHIEGILRRSVAPAPRVEPALEEKALGYGRNLLSHLRHVGLLAIEFCEYKGELFAIEMAPRVHNSGHWTIEGAHTSQYENHLRAILGLPLGSTQQIGTSIMINLIGNVPDISSLLSIPNAHLHLYNKEPKPQRKLGHVTVCSPDIDTLHTSVRRLQSLIDVTR